MLPKEMQATKALLNNHRERIDDEANIRTGIYTNIVAN